MGEIGDPTLNYGHFPLGRDIWKSGTKTALSVLSVERHWSWLFSDEV